MVIPCGVYSLLFAYFQLWRPLSRAQPVYVELLQDLGGTVTVAGDDPSTLFSVVTISNKCAIVEVSVIH